MEQKKLKIAVVVCAVLFLLGCFVSSAFSQDTTQQWEHSEGGSIVLSEILASNQTCPGPDGQLLDFIEIHNLSASSVDISGYMLADDLSSIGYTFPENTVIPGYGYMVCWCNKDSNAERYASFGISRTGGDTIYLYNAANVLVDQKEVSAVPANTSLIRTADAAWQETIYPTPGYSNDEAGFAAWLKSKGTDEIQVTITEIMADSGCTAVSGMVCDWVEITNTGKKTAVLTGAYLSNDPLEPLKWQIPTLELEPGERAVIPCMGKGDGTVGAAFAISKTGCTVVLTGQYGNTISSVQCPSMEEDHSYALGEDGTYRVTDLVTPGYSNDEAGDAQWRKDMGMDQLNVVITEVQTANRSALLGGKLPDWVEITNMGQEVAVLDGAYLSDDPEQRGKWQIPSLTLQPGESKVILCSGETAVEGEADFSLPRAGSVLILSGPAGNILSKTECPQLDNDRSWALVDGIYQQTDRPTPGYPNTEDGYLTYLESQKPTGALVVSEVMAANSEYLVQTDGNYYDWIELVNVSNKAVNLADYCLSTDSQNLEMFRLPDKTLDPGARVIVICAGDVSLMGKYIFANFTLSAQEDWIYISSAGSIVDHVHIVNVQENESAGRMTDQNKIVYFNEPTPGRANGTGVALISGMPTVLTAPGIYQQASVKVEIQGEGTLRYTLDGSQPDEKDPVYDGPLELTETTVLRVAAFEEGKLQSRTLTASYIINENHSLPVLSLAADPAELAEVLSSKLGEPEAACSLQFFEESGSFSIDAEVQRSGSLGSSNPKPSCKINFRGRYGASVLGYPVFGEDGEYVFDALLLRSGSDYDQTIFRDELFTSLAADMEGTLPYQSSRFCVLYVNGEYYGIYTLKEDLDTMFYAQLTGAAEKNITVISDPAVHASEIYNLAEYCGENDLSQQEHYDYVTGQLDVDSFIDWLILQGYSCNSDVAGNLKYFHGGGLEDRWQTTLYDLDNGFYYRDGFKNVLLQESPQQYAVIATALMENSNFREKFLQRLKDALEGPLSDQAVLARIGQLEALLAPEISRERSRWGGTVEDWTADVARLRTYLTRYDHHGMLVQSLRDTIALTDEEAKTYFGR